MDAVEELFSLSLSEKFKAHNALFIYAEEIIKCCDDSLQRLSRNLT